MKVTTKAQVLTPFQQLIVMLIISVLTAFCAYGIYLALMVRRPAPEEQVAEFTRALLADDSSAIYAVMSEAFKQQYSRPALQERLQAFELLPADKGVPQHPPVTFKAKGHSHVRLFQSEPGPLLRLELILEPNLREPGWKIADFCHVERNLRRNVKNFLKALQASDWDKAFRYTVDHAYRRQTPTFTHALLGELNGRYLGPRGTWTLGPLTLEGTDTYRQRIMSSEADFDLLLSHRLYNQYGCLFMVVKWEAAQAEAQ